MSRDTDCDMLMWCDDCGASVDLNDLWLDPADHHTTGTGDRRFCRRCFEERDAEYQREEAGDGR